MGGSYAAGLASFDIASGYECVHVALNAKFPKGYTGKCAKPAA